MFGACAKPTFSGMGCRCVSCHDFGALGSGWEKFKRFQKLVEGLRRVRRQLSGGRKEPRSQEEAKSPEAENTGPRARPTKTFVKIESWSVSGKPKRSKEEAKRSPRGAQEVPRASQEEPKRSQEEAKRNQE